VKRRIFSGILLLLMMVSLVRGFPLTAYGASALKSSDSLIQVIKGMEGFESKPYWDNGHWAIGYGTTCPDDKVDAYNKTGITVAQAEEMLKQELARFENAVNGFADKYKLTLKQQQFDALVSFTYNCGEAWMSETTGYFNNAIRDQVTGTDLIYSMALYSGAAGSYPLIKRRLCEANMYLNGVYKAYNASGAVPSNYKYVYLDGNGGDVRYVICAFDSNEKATIDVEFKSIPTGKDSAGKVFAYSLAGWYTADGKKVTALDGNLKNGQVLYAKWADPAGKVTGIPKGKTENLTVTVTADSVNVRKGPGTFYDKVTTYAKGSKVTITQTYNVGDYVWGQTDKGWFLLDYSDYEAQKAAQTQFPRKGFVTTDNVNVRTGPGTDYSRVTQMHKGDAVTIHEVRAGGSYQWGRLDSGNWICMDYVMYAEEGSTVKSISMYKLPDKTEYLQNQEKLDLSGSVLLVTYHDGSTAAMTLTRSMVSGFSNAKTGKVTISVSYEGCATSFQVTVTKDCSAGHTWNSGVKTSAPTCTQPGKMTYTCVDCGTTKTEDIAALGHAWDAWKDTAGDSHSRTCLRNCGVAAQTETHSWSGWSPDGDSNHKKTCSVCSGTRTEAHGWDNGVVTKEATHTETGIKTYTCAACSHSYEEEIPMTTEHIWEKWEPHANNDGLHICYCECGEEKEEPHTWGKWTAQDSGRFFRKCVCGEEETLVLDENDPVHITPADNAANMHLMDTDIQLVEKVLTDEEQSQLADGTDIKIWLKAEDITAAPPADVVSAVEANMGKYKAGMYLDMGLFKQIADAEPVRIHALSDPLTVTITVPEELLNTDETLLRVYRMVCVYEDKDGSLRADMIRGTFDPEDSSFTFQTDKFSACALVFMDKTAPVGIPGDINRDEVVNTEDVVSLLLYISMPDMFPVEDGVLVDFNEDDATTTEDAVQLLLHISMPDMFPLVGKN